jgi:two-component system cell cycle response regulator
MRASSTKALSRFPSLANVSPVLSGSILVVDDDRFFREIVRDLLARKGHQVTLAEGGAQALELAAGARFDVVVSDVVMPGIDGFALIAALRERDPSQEIILVSNRQDVKGSVTALRAGVADCLVKPVEEADLQLAVERALERAALRRERTRLQDEASSLARYPAIHQRCLEFLAQPELEWLQERVLAELAAFCDAQSGALWLLEEKAELVLRAYRGLLDKHFLSERFAIDEALGKRVSAAAPWLSGEGRARALFVPLVSGGEVVGLVQLSDPIAGDFRADDLQSARILADFAGVALRNARRFLALQRLGLRDRDTAAYNLSYFTDYASKEIYKARRYGRTFSLLTFSIDNLPQVKLRLGADVARRATRGIIRALSKIVRDSDVIAKASEQEFYLLLPETDFFGAMMFSRRARAAVRDDKDVQDVEGHLPLSLVWGASTFPKDGEDFDELVHVCRRRMDERRASLQRKLMLDGLSFWEEVELLLGNPGSPRLPTDERSEPSRRGKVSDGLLHELQAEIARDLLRDPSARGLLYLGVPDVRSDLPLAQDLESAPPELGSRVYVVGRRADLESHRAVTPVFVEGDERIARHEFLLWLSENSAYVLLQRPGLGATWGFHSSDAALVDGLIAKLQAEYDLQPF